MEQKEFDPKKAAEERKREMEEITKKLEKGVKDIFDGDNYKKYLKFCSKLPRYSVNNQILIMLQRPDATSCQSFSGWKEMKRFVKKGEKGIRILAPSPYKKEVEQQKTDSNGAPIFDSKGEPVMETVEITVNAFKPVSTFDVSQTEGEPVPGLGVEEIIGGVDGYEIMLDAIRSSISVPIEFEDISSGAKGYYHVEENRIAVQKDMSEAQTIKTLLHEASHAVLHSHEAMKDTKDKPRSQKECEAESVAFVVCSHYGIDTSDYSFPYVAGWSSGKEVPELKASLDTIRRAASDLITKIDEHLKAIDVIKNVDEFMEEHGDELPFADSEPPRESIMQKLKDNIGGSGRNPNRNRDVAPAL
ncbi:MAG: ImmA/IrrE family metallo-endopeptidase [Lachnospiraceae bacterium]|nr:ImmA/IrrE family metallo-endopeptidase [Lachnospiraceae bacterium]